jgi:CDP-glycerol glycerophosphotransferase
MDTPRAAARGTDRARSEAAVAMAAARRHAKGLARRGVHLARRDPRLQRIEVRVRSRLQRPAVTVVLPVYNVEPYVGECLDSIAAQTFTDYEVVVVDDGSTDGSMAVVEERAARDHRIRVVHRANGGLGAARNTGVKHARGTFLTFVDSDDALPPRALEALVRSARASGSEIVVGGVRRFNTSGAWVPTWVPKVHGERRSGVTLSHFLPVLRNLYTWNKLFRRDWFAEQGLWFREGVPYEDQPIITQLLDRARSIDVIPEIVYLYRQREDQSSISQQTSTVPDLQARITAWEVTRDVLRDEADPAVYVGWLQTLFDSHFHWYLQSRGTADPTYWRLLQAAIINLSETAPRAVWDATAPDKRVVIELARQGRQADLEEFMRLDARRWENWPSTVRDDGVEVELPFFGDPALDRELFLIRPPQLRLAHALEHAHWLRDTGGTGGTGDTGAGASVLQLSGWAYLGKVDLSRHTSEVVVVLRGPDGAERRFPSTGRPPGAYPPPLDDAWCDYRPGTFQVELPLHEVMDGTAPGESWSVLLEVSAAGFTVTSPVTVLLRSGCAGVLPAGHLEDGDRVLPDWIHGEPLRLRRQPSTLRTGDAALVDGALTATLGGPAADTATRVRVETPGRRVERPVRVGSDGVRRFRVELPRPEAAGPGRPTWCGVTGVGRDGSVTPLASLGGPGVLDEQQYGDGAVTLERTRTATLAAVHWPYGARAEQLDVSVDGVLTVSGSVFGTDVRELSLVTAHKKVQAAGPSVAVADGRFRADLPLRHDLYRFGSLPLPIGDHDLSARLVVDGQPSPVEVPLRMAATLDHRLPVTLRTDHYEGRIVRGPETGTRLTLVRPLGDDAGKYRQQQLRSRPVPRRLHRGLLVRSYFGESATDNGVSVQRELARRGAELPVYWAVHDHSVPVPEGGIPVIVNSAEHHELRSSVSYYLDNMFQPEHHLKPEGQVMVQTFHGYPFKQMGQPHWENVGFSQARIRSYHRRAAEWDYLVSPATYATPLLKKHFHYDGEVLEIGYPRNDVLQSEDAPRLRQVVRASLGLRDDQLVVLYAPTFRDYLSRDDNKARMGDFFDFLAAHRRLGDDVVILVRGHAFNARSNDRVGDIPGTIDVTDYPEVSDLYLAADAAIVDYSSLRFDFGVTGKPMIFHVPDLERYVATRGWLFDFEPTAPGPLVETTDEVVDQLLDLDGVVRRHQEQYAAFRRTYLDLEDGHAGRRFVDRVFVPRGDAPPDNAAPSDRTAAGATP